MDLGESPTFRVTVLLVMGRCTSFFKITSCKHHPENGPGNISQGLAVLTYQARMCRTAQDPWQNCFPQRSRGWQATCCMKSGCYLLLHDPWAKGGFYISTWLKKNLTSNILWQMNLCEIQISSFIHSFIRTPTFSFQYCLRHVLLHYKPQSWAIISEVL